MLTFLTKSPFYSCLLQCLDSAKCVCSSSRVGHPFLFHCFNQWLSCFLKMNQLFDACRLSFTYRIWLGVCCRVGKLHSLIQFHVGISAIFTYFLVHPIVHLQLRFHIFCQAFHCHVFVTCTVCKKGFQCTQNQRNSFSGIKWPNTKCLLYRNLLRFRFRFGSDGFEQRDRGWEEKSYRKFLI